MQTPPHEVALLAYALWDADNTTKLRKPEDIAEYIEYAERVLSWLRVLGGDLICKERPPGPDVVRELPTECTDCGEPSCINNGKLYAPLHDKCYRCGRNI